VIDDDTRWFQLLRAYYDRFKYHNILTEDLVAFFNQQTGKNLTPIFDQYLRRAASNARIAISGKWERRLSLEDRHQGFRNAGESQERK